MKKRLLALLLYAIVFAMAFYLLPLLIVDTGIGMLVLLLVIPLLIFICSVVYGVQQGFDFLFTIAVIILFAPTMFYYNMSAWVYMIAYALISLAGNGIGRTFHRRKSDGGAQP